MHLQLLLILFNYIIIIQYFNIVNGAANDFSLYGIIESYLIPIDPRKAGQIYSSCFGGLELLHCIPKLSEDDVIGSYDRPYYVNLGTLTSSIGGLKYCLECCGNPPDFIDTWDLYCTMNAGTSITTNVYGYEIRMARNRDKSDTTVIKCPIKRSACNYTDTGETILCDRTKDRTFLLGYTVTFTVEQYDANFGLWRGISSCEVESYEGTKALQDEQTFHERIIMKHVPINTFSTADYGKVAIIAISCFFGIYLSLYFCRKKRCEYCKNKLVFSPSLCYKCVIVGAQRPDPVLLAALEEKTINIQGEIPENFIYYKSIVNCFWGILFIPVLLYKFIKSIFGFIFFRKYKSNTKVTPFINVHSLSKKMKDIESAVKNNPNNHQLDDDEDDEDNNVYPIPSAVLNDDNWMTEEQKEEEEIKTQLALKSKKYAKKFKKEKRQIEQKRKKQMYLKSIEIDKKNPNILNYDINTIYQAVNVQTI